MSPSLSNPLTARGGQAVSAVSVLAFCTTIILVVLLAGCGGGEKGKDSLVLAKVGSADITAAYYEDRLVRLEKNELPRNADGSVMDMSLQEGKQKFLETIINKEVMVQTAKTMGLQNDPTIANAQNTLLAYEAGLVLWDRAIQEPANTISPEELEAFYDKMGSSRNCLYVITNFLEDAESARNMALDGADWEDLVNQFHDGMPPADGKYEITVPFGRYTPEYENGVFDTEIGGITPPINTVYGYWVLKVLSEKEGKKPSLEEAKANILDITHLRKLSHLKDEFKKSVVEKFELTIHEEALWKCYLGLPRGETLFKDGTQTPRDQDELAPLQVATEDMDLPFYSYLDLDRVKKEFTLLDYKTHFDKMSVFQRPKEAEMLGGLRNKIQGELEKTVLNFEAQDIGLFEDPAVTGKVNLKIEEMIVSKLYIEVVQFDERVTPEQLEAYWAENHERFNVKETRTGRLIVALNEELAAEARAKALEGTDWRDLLFEYGTNKENKAVAGNVEGIVNAAGNPISVAMFALEVGSLSEPFPLEGGRFAVVRLDSVTPERPREMIEVSEGVGQKIREIRKEEAFQAKLDEWKEKITVTEFPDKLAEVSSWEELNAQATPENLVPRN